MRKLVSLAAAGLLCAAVAIAQPAAAAPVDNPVASVAKKKCKGKAKKKGKCGRKINGPRPPKAPPIEIGTGAPIINGGCPDGCRDEDSETEEFAAKKKCSAKAKKKGKCGKKKASGTIPLPPAPQLPSGG